MFRPVAAAGRAYGREFGRVQAPVSTRPSGSCCTPSCTHPGRRSASSVAWYPVGKMSASITIRLLLQAAYARKVRPLRSELGDALLPPAATGIVDRLLETQPHLAAPLRPDATERFLLRLFLRRYLTWC